MSSEHPAVDSTYDSQPLESHSEADEQLGSTSLGGLYIGIVVGSALWGVTALQTWSYYREYPEDAWQLKLLIAVAFTLDTVHQIFISHTGYLYLVSNYFNPRALEHVQWSIKVEVLVAGLVAVLVQGFFVSRIYKLSNKRMVLTLGVTVLVVCQFTAYILYCAKAFGMKTFAQISTVKDFSMSINATTVAADLAITGALCCLLHKSRTGIKCSDTMINRMIIFTVTSGLLTSLDSICSLVTIAALPNTYIYITFFFALSRLYVNSLLATLNARARYRRDAAITSSFSIGPFGARPGVELENISALDMHPHSKNIAIRIDTTKEFRREGSADSDTESVRGSTITKEEANPSH
ncbi:hypothetical protein FA95DRAFT_1607948 [Auriscalpium vulgare]|uniref:Uncharacterized protein n=1 Tax=Auriscalpium vulgare TaxID=40419 RepID=A0ACB8RND9_9AGAM|nr:hypothetical protein FA95DRAFT_1607948 [Auriscalpium vulgare]